MTGLIKYKYLAGLVLLDLEFYAVGVMQNLAWQT